MKSMDFLLIDGDEKRLAICREVVLCKLYREHSPNYTLNVNKTANINYNKLATERLRILQASKNIRMKFERGEITGSMV
jgi:hypothetical protein